MAEEFPPTLQGVSLTALSVGELPAFRTDNSEIGPPTNQLLTTNPPTYFQVNWVFFPVDFLVFEGWFRYTLVFGVKSFNIKLPVGAGIQTHECNFLTGSAPYNATQQGRLVSVSTTLRAIEKQVVTEVDFNEMLGIVNAIPDKNKAPVIRDTIVPLPDAFIPINYGTDTT